MNIRTKNGLKVSTAAILVAALSLSPIGPASPVSIPVSAVEFTGDFDTGDFDVWDGVSYDFSWFNPALDSYEISSAAQLASLSILTNDLSQGFDTWASALPPNCDAYKAACYDFSDKTITLTVDIDLGNHDWLPISYPFKTPNITHTDYNALGHVPAYLTSVDPWVGDGEGNEIITRYLEYPESEMRFRDLLYLRNSNDAVNQQIDKSSSLYSMGYSAYAVLQIEATGGLSFIDEVTAMNVATDVIKDPRASGVVYPAVQLRPITNMDILDSYYYSDVKEAGANSFKGTFDGNSKRIKGLHPKTAWTDDTLERLTTFDPIGKGLFGVLDDTGSIVNLNIKGTYDSSDVVSYSAFLCAYNYGLIKNCYVDGSMAQGLVSQKAPLHRKYGKYDAQGNIIEPSTYEFLSGDVTVLPVGNSGFVSAINNGRIEQVVTAGAVTQAFRQFGFFASINNGVIKSCENKANFSTSSESITFCTDEWYPSLDYEVAFDRLTWAIQPSTTLDYSLNNVYKNYSYTSAASAIADAGYHRRYTSVLDWSNMICSDAWMHNNNYGVLNTAAQLQGWTDNDRTSTMRAWVPYIYEPLNGQSLAANHIYGVYGLARVGGIAAVNYGTIALCTNSGEIHSMLNLSPRSNSHTLNGSSREAQSYIRPGTIFSLFSTQERVQSLAAGIAVLSTGNIYGCVNHGDIVAEDKASEFDAVRSRARSASVDVGKSSYGALAYCGNGFYRNDCVVYDENDEPVAYNPMGQHWYLTHPDTDAFDEPFVKEVSFSSILPYHYTETGVLLDAGNNVVWDPLNDIYDVDPDDVRHIEHRTYTTYAAADNMPYPFVAFSFTLKSLPDDSYGMSDDRTSIIITSGIAVYNQGIIDKYDYDDDTVATAQRVVNDGAAMCGIVFRSEGAASNVRLANADQNGACNYNIGYYLVNTETEHCTVTNPVGHYGIALVAMTTNELSAAQHDIVVYKGVNGYYRLIGDNARMPVSNIILYDNEPAMASGVAGYSTNVDFKDVVNFQNSILGLSRLNNCNIDTFYMFGNTPLNLDVHYIASDTVYGLNLGCGVGIGSIESYMKNIHFYGESSGLTFGHFKGGQYDNLYCYTRYSDPCSENKGIIRAEDATISNLFAFTYTSDAAIYCKNCDLTDAIVYLDTTDMRNKPVNVFYFEDCDCTNVLLESNITAEYKDPNTGSWDILPGVLKSISDDNNFTDVYVQTPDGVVSYVNYNFAFSKDTTIRSDASLNYDEDARASGSMAYAATEGSDANKIYVVASNDTYTLITDELLTLTDASYIPEVFGERPTVTLPAYTREQLDDSELRYYCITIPFMSNGAGEIIGTTDSGYATSALQAAFPRTKIYLREGDTYTLDIVENEGFGLLKLLQVDEGTEPVEIPFTRNEQMTYIMPSHDIQYLSEWTYVYKIEKKEYDNITLETNAEASIAGETINVYATLTGANKEISRVYYYNYIKDTSNRYVLDSSNPVEIDLQEMTFIMPNNPVIIYADLVSTVCEVKSFVLAGVEGDINNEKRTITVALDSSVDVTDIAPDSFITDAVSISPAPDARQDFTSPVTYTLTCENGDVVDYTVTVYPLQDGVISYFEMLGYAGVIDNEAHTISVELPIEVNLSAVVPKILWSGVSITPDGVVDLRSKQLVYTIVTSTGDEVSYTLNITIAAEQSSTALQSFECVTANNVPLHFVIDDTTMTATAVVPYGTDITSCRITGLQYAGYNGALTLNDVLNLTKSNYIAFMDLNGTAVSYKVVVIESLPSDKILEQLALYGYFASIDNDTLAVNLAIPSKYDLSNVAADLLVFTGEDAVLYSNNTALDSIYSRLNWELPVCCEVLAYDGSSNVYTVNIVLI